MTPKQLKENLKYLVCKYISDESHKKELVKEIQNTDVDDLGVRGILHEISSSSNAVSEQDGILIRELVFSFG